MEKLCTRRQRSGRKETAGVRREKKPHQNQDKPPQNHKMLIKN